MNNILRIIYEVFDLTEIRRMPISFFLFDHKPDMVKVSSYQKDTSNMKETLHLP